MSLNLTSWRERSIAPWVLRRKGALSVQLALLGQWMWVRDRQTKALLPSQIFRIEVEVLQSFAR